MIMQDMDGKKYDLPPEQQKKFDEKLALFSEMINKQYGSQHADILAYSFPFQLSDLLQREFKQFEVKE